MLSCFLEGGGCSRPVAPAEFPLAVGGARAALPVPGSEQPLAWIGAEGSELFVQPARDGEDGAVSCNGVALRASRWLRDGDQVRAGTTRIEVRVAGGTVTLRHSEPGPGAAALGGHEGELVVRATPFQPVLGGKSGARSRPRAPAPRRLAAVAGFVALLALAAFFLIARPIAVRVTPTPDQLAVSGPWPGLRIGGRHWLLPGQWQVSARLAGHRPLDHELAVSRDTPTELALRLEPLPGRLRVAIEPAVAAEVRIDGQVLAPESDGDLLVAAGEHELQVVAERYEPYSARIVVAGAGAAEHHRAVLVPRFVALPIDSDPQGAALTVDGQLAGATPLVAELLAGSRVLEWTLDGFEPERRTVTIVVGTTTAIAPARMRPARARLRLTTIPPAALVAVDGAYRGQSPLTLELTPGESHTIAASKAGHLSVEHSVRLAAGASERLELSLAVRSPQPTPAPTPGRTPAPRPDELAASQAARRERAPDTTLHAPTPIAVDAAAVSPGVAAVGPGPGPNGHTLVLLPRGSFTMGSRRGEAGRRANEVVRLVTLARPVVLATRETSNGQFRAFRPEHRSGRFAGADLDGDTQPVARVSWADAARYCNWLSAGAGLSPFYVESGGRLVPAEPPGTGWRLPTEAEWEWAARAAEGGEPRRYPWGMALPVAPRSGNWADASAAALLAATIPDYEDGFPASAPVASFAASGLGLHDMGGNVAEWVHDVYAGGLPVDARTVDPLGPAEGPLHLIRGSSWMHWGVTELRLAFRDYGDKPRPDLGFRVARYVE